jgi:hypothetical protein
VSCERCWTPSATPLLTRRYARNGRCSPCCTAAARSRSVPTPPAPSRD